MKKRSKKLIALTRRRSEKRIRRAIAVGKEKEPVRKAKRQQEHYIEERTEDVETKK
jgi:hypothetical protein